MKLMEAVEQTILHLETTLNLATHPASCCCYGCNLKTAYVNQVLTDSQKAVQPIVDAERKAELPFGGENRESKPSN